MPSFNYTALDSKGQKISGEIDACDRRDAIKKLKAQELNPLKIKDSGSKDTKISSENFGSDEPTKEKPKSLFSFGKKKSFGNQKTVLEFFRKLYQLHSNGLPVGDAIKTLSQRISDPALKALNAELWKSLSEGFSLAASMGRYPETFEPTIIHLIEAGEQTGNMLPVLENIVKLIEDRIKLRKTILSSLTYPIFISVVALGVVALFLFFLLPKIQGMLDSLGGDLSFSAKLLIWVSDFMLTKGPFVIGGLFAGSIFYAQWSKTKKGRIKADRLILKIPFLGSILRNAEICRMTNLMATLLESGVNTTETLKLTEKVVKNSLLKNRFIASRLLISDGLSISAALKRNHLLDNMDIDILSVGENTGNLVKRDRKSVV